MDVWHEDSGDDKSGLIISIIAFGMVMSAIVGGAVVWFAFGGGL